MCQQQRRHFRVTPENREIESRRIPVSAAFGDRPAELDHKPGGRCRGTPGDRIRQQSELRQRGRRCWQIRARCLDAPRLRHVGARRRRQQTARLRRAARLLPAAAQKVRYASVNPAWSASRYALMPSRVRAEGSAPATSRACDVGRTERRTAMARNNGAPQKSCRRATGRFVRVAGRAQAKVRSEAVGSGISRARPQRVGARSPAPRAATAAECSQGFSKEWYPRTRRRSDRHLLPAAIPSVGRVAGLTPAAPYRADSLTPLSPRTRKTGGNRLPICLIRSGTLLQKIAGTSAQPVAEGCGQLH